MSRLDLETNTSEDQFDQNVQETRIPPAKMKLVKQEILHKTGEGFAIMKPEEPEDMWHAYNLIRPNDLLRASAVRKVITESAGSGSRSNERVHTTLTIRVTKQDFDPQAGQLHVSGRVAEENPIVKLGGYHTLDLELQRNFTLEKSEGWDSVAIATLKEACDNDAKAQLWAVIMKEGLANICLVTDHQTILKQKIEYSLPRKRAGSTDHEKSMQKFFHTTYDSLLRHVDLANPKPLLLASPAFTAGQFQQYIKAQAAISMDKRVKDLLPKITVAQSASGHLHSLNEVLSSPAVTSKLSDTKFARETQLVDKFFELMRHEDNRAWYGPRESEKAVEQGAVGKGGGVLLISNGLFRSQDVGVRDRWVKCVDSVREQGGEVRVLSSMHESGRRLESLGGVAVILTYPMEDLDELGEGEVEEEQPESEDEHEHGANGHSHGVEGRRDHEEDIDFL
ncbi:Translation factor pelota [Elasticomyces elasticus]|nr:Translation factor pelota [Elasticomyces elasticus]